MIYEIKDEWLIIKKHLCVQKIDIRKITKIICGEKIKLFSDDQLLYNTAWNIVMQKMAEEIYFNFACPVLEYSNNIIDKWKQLPESQFRCEVQKAATFLEIELEKYQERVAFEIHHEIVVREETWTAVLTIWGEKDGEKIFLLPTSKQDLLWGGQLMFAA